MKPRATIAIMTVFAFVAAAWVPAWAEGETADPVAEIDGFIAAQKSGDKIDTAADQWRTKLPKPPQATFTPGTDYFWILETSKGTIRIALMPAVAPMHVSSTIYLTNLGFYDSLGFHRVISNFMAQGGCPLGNGRGGPGYRFAGEYSRTVTHDRPYLLSMANAGPNTDGSQFFITFKPTPHLNGKHTIFGEVVEGQDVVKAIEAAGSGSGRPSEPIAIKKASIEIAKSAPQAVGGDD